METRTVFLDDAGHLRSGWRLVFFGIAFLVCAKLLGAVSTMAGAGDDAVDCPIFGPLSAASAASPRAPTKSIGTRARCN